MMPQIPDNSADRNLKFAATRVWWRQPP